MINRVLDNNDKNNNEDKGVSKENLYQNIDEKIVKHITLNLEELIFIDDRLTLLIEISPISMMAAPLVKTFPSYNAIPCHFDLIHKVINSLNYLNKTKENEIILEMSESDLFILREISKSGSEDFKNSTVREIKFNTAINLKLKVAELLADSYVNEKKIQDARKALYD